MHICYGYGIQANIDWKHDARRASGGNTSGSSRRWRRAASTRSRSNAPIRTCRSSCLALLAGKDVLVGAIDVASDEAETPEQVAATIEAALRFVPPERLYPCTNCGMAPLDRTLASQKLAALAAGAALVRGRLGPRISARAGLDLPAPRKAPALDTETLREAMLANNPTRRKGILLAGDLL